MYRSALRSAPRVVNTLRQSHLATSGRRFASTSSPADGKRSWKSSALRWGLAIGAVYWYSTSAVFAEEPQLQTIPPPPQFSDDDLPTVEAVIAQKRKEAEARAHKTAAPESKTIPKPETEALATDASPEAPVKEIETETTAPAPAEGSPEALEEEAAQQGAFNPETGEINWDCPCLGGMAHGPCGEEFKAAFSCFVYSTEEPKGMDCIDKFQHMQDCFRLHPEVYGDELADDENANEAGEAEVEGAFSKDAPEGNATAVSTSAASPPAEKPTESTPTQAESSPNREATNLTEKKP
ncbi:hypothetical protein F5Y17DRAFT_429086 [Xylariaceae sp. FL0594]|nr:hypothetical protein F5Y17DRAFT_429086 [Xylariaceae sp. FL0594]